MRGIRLGAGAVALVALVAVSGCGQTSPTTEALGKSEQALSTGLVISAVYGGAATGGSYKNDYVEIFNRGATPVVLTGITLQYSRNDYRTWNAAGNVVTLTGTIPPGGYYLVKYAANAAGAADLPTSDATGTTNYATGGGLVAIVNGTTALDCGPAAPITLADGGPGADPDGGAAVPCTAASIIDFVGYGKTGASPAAAPVYEGTGSAPTGTVTGVIRRKGNGCTETDDNNNDFELVAHSATVVPRNSATAVNLCAVSTDAAVDVPMDTAVIDTAVIDTGAADGGAGDVKVDADAATGDTGATADTTPEDTGSPDEDTGTPALDTGTPAADTGAAAVDTGTATDEVTDDDGCGCRVAGGDRSSALAGVAGLIFALGALARRRR